MSAETEGRAAAEKFRVDHHLGVQPLGDLVVTIEQATGFDVAMLRVEPDEHGLTMRDPVRGAVFIGVACTSNPMRQRSTLAHELAHVLFEDWTDSSEVDWGGRDYTESRADAFARHLLLPLQGLHEFLEERTTVAESDLSAVVQRFLLSPRMAAIQLEQGGHISTALKTQWKDLTTPQLAARYGWTDQYLALKAESEHPRAPQRLLARANRGYAESVLPAQAIATLRGITVAEAEAELHKAGIFPIESEAVWAGASDLPEVDVDLTDLLETLGVPSDGDTDERSERDL
ncbi:ImmA/IrrE family metallo-endopeptidase [Actinosynnema sp. NPDC059797]